MNLNFTMDPDYLLAHTLRQTDSSRWWSDEYKEDIEGFQKAAWDISPENYSLLIGRVWPEMYLDIPVSDFVTQLPQFISQAKGLPEFSRLSQQVTLYQQYCESKWKQHLDETQSLISSLTDFDLAKSFTVYITHPTLKNTSYLGNSRLTFGGMGNYPNFEVVQIWHYILHEYFAEDSISHLVLELLADNEIRSRINHTAYPPFEGHSDSFPSMQQLLPAWKDYHSSGRTDIQSFVTHAAQLLGGSSPD